MSQLNEDLEAQKLAGFISPPTAWILWIIACFMGFLLGWYTNYNAESKAFCLLVSICFAVAASWPMKFWVSWLEGRKEALNRMEMQELKQQLKEKNKPRKQKKETRKNGFTDDDFDKAAKSMLMKPVKKARRAGAKVTGQGLVETFLKGIR